MAVLRSFQSFRSQFSIYVWEQPTVSFVSGTPATITRGSGSFVTEGYLDGHYLDVTDGLGSTTVNAGRRLIDTVAATTLTLAAGETLTNEGPIDATFHSRFIDKDGYERWPDVDTYLHPSAFDDGFTGIPQPFDGTDFTVAVSGYTDDEKVNEDEYNWYLSQRTDDVSKQLLSIEQTPNAGGISYSGSVIIGISDYGLTQVSLPLSMNDQLLLFKYCHLYVQHLPTKNIQWVDLLEATIAGF